MAVIDALDVGDAGDVGVAPWFGGLEEAGPPRGAPAHARRRPHRAWPWVAIVVALYYAVSFGLLAHWQDEGWFPPTGDEPHYLVMAKGIVVDHTLDQTVPSEQEFASRSIYPPGLAAPGSRPDLSNAQVINGPHGQFSIHNVGLPIVLAPAFWAGGVLGAKVALVLLSGLAVAAAAYLALRRIRSRVAAVAVAGAVAVGLPLVPAAGQVYPDVLAGSISLIVLVAVITTRAPRSRLADVGLGLLVAFQPWLQIKFALPAAIGAGALVVEQIRRGRRSRAVALVAGLAASLALLAAYNAYAFGDVTGPYSGDTALQASTTSLMVFLGLHIDRFQGILLQNPLLALGLFELIRSCARRREWAWWTLAIYLSFVVPNAMHPDWYGGLSFAGRFAWSGAIVLIAPTVIALGRLWDRSRAATAALLAGAGALQAWFFVGYGLRHFDLYNQDANVWLADYHSLYGGFARFLPALYDRAWAFRYPANDVAFALVALVVVVALAAVGSARTFRRRAIPAGVLLGGAYVVACLAVGAPTPPRTFPASQLPGEVGHVAGGSRLASSPGDRPGWLTYGPGVSLAPGRYSFTLAYRASAPNGGVAGSWDVVVAPVSSSSTPVGSTELAGGALADDGGRSEQVSRPFVVPSGHAEWTVQVRTVFSGPGSLQIDHLTLAKG
jgi:hypothetical protein